MTRGLRKVFAVGLLAIPLVASCGDDKAKIAAAAPCHINTDCKDPLVCGLGTCHTACESSRDCNVNAGEHCLVTSGESHICAIAEDKKCAYNTECKAEDPLLICAKDLQCRSECETAADCAKSQICVMPDRLCADQNELTDGMLADLGGPGRDGKDGDASSEGGTGNTPGEGGSGNTPGEGGNTTGATGTGGKAGHPTGGSIGAGGVATAEAGAAGSSTQCPFGTGDCDDNPDDCETDLALIDTCGACNVKCKPSHGPVLCDPDVLKCVVNTQVGCDPGYADCNHDGQDGCESAPDTDADNCGMCGHTCGGGKCAAGQCSAPIFFDPTKAPTAGITYNQSGDTFLVGNSFFKLNADNGTEFRVAALPTSPATLSGSVLVSSSSAVYAVAVDSTNVYYAIGGNPASVLYKPLTAAASTPAQLAVTQPNSYVAAALTATSSEIYLWSTPPGSGTFRGSSTILVADKAAIPASASALPGLANLGHEIVSQLIVSGGNLFWIGVQASGACGGCSSFDVYSAPLGGGTALAIANVTASTVFPNVSVVSDGSYAYWTTSMGAGSKVQRVLAKTPSVANVKNVALGINATSQSLVVDDTYVYYLQNSQIFRVIKDGSLSPEPLANVNQAPNIYNLFAVDDKFVYGTGSGGQIVGVQKDALSK